MENRPRTPQVDEVPDLPRRAPRTPSLPARLGRRFMQQTRGAIALNFALGVVTGYAIAALLGFVTPITAAFVGLGSQVIGTVAFFVTYYVGRDER